MFFKTSPNACNFQPPNSIEEEFLPFRKSAPKCRKFDPHKADGSQTRSESRWRSPPPKGGLGFRIRGHDKPRLMGGGDRHQSFPGGVYLWIQALPSPPQPQKGGFKHFNQPKFGSCTGFLYIGDPKKCANKTCQVVILPSLLVSRRPSNFQLQNV